MVLRCELFIKFNNKFTLVIIILIYNKTADKNKILKLFKTQHSLRIYLYSIL